MCANHRGFTLLSPGKVYSKVLERRIQPIVEPQIEEEQHKFCPGCGTTELLFTLAWKDPGRSWGACIAFVDDVVLMAPSVSDLQQSLDWNVKWLG